ncbi:MAG: hypothetical protein HC774_04725 [Sphingomonadales bacterium]|nr:hypothetical protein [Sphingomonadales bacterium]
MLRRGGIQAGRLQVMVLRRDQHVEGVRRGLGFLQRCPRLLGNWRLKEGRLGQIIHNQGPRLIAWKLWRQSAQETAPLAFLSRRLRLAGGQHRHCADLRQKAMQGLFLVRPERG